MSSSMFRVWIPLLVFPALSALAYRLMLGNLVASGGAAQLAHACAARSGADAKLCVLVTFFHAALHPANLPLNVDFAASMAALVAIPSLEAARHGTAALLALPTLLGALYQLFGGGVVMPAYWLLFLLAQQHRARARVPLAHARAVLASVAAGFGGLTVLMYARRDDARAIALWQVFPVCVAALQAAALLAARPAARARPGHAVVRLTLGLTLVLSAAAHAGVVRHLWGDPAALRHFFVPRVRAAPAPEGTPLAAATMQFLQWDAAFFFGSSLLATLWFAESAAQVGALLLWDVVASVALGPGAALSAVFLWREARLEGRAREAERRR